MQDIGVIVLVVLGLVAALIVLDQRGVRKSRDSLRKDPSTGEYVWTDIDGTIRRSDVHPGKRHTDTEAGGAWGDGTGPGPEG